MLRSLRSSGGISFRTMFFATSAVQLMDLMEIRSHPPHSRNEGLDKARCCISTSGHPASKHSIRVRKVKELEIESLQTKPSSILPQKQTRHVDSVRAACHNPTPGFSVTLS